MSEKVDVERLARAAARNLADDLASIGDDEGSAINEAWVNLATSTIAEHFQSLAAESAALKAENERLRELVGRAATLARQMQNILLRHVEIYPVEKKWMDDVDCWLTRAREWRGK